MSAVFFIEYEDEDESLNLDPSALERELLPSRGLLQKMKKVQIDAFTESGAGFKVKHLNPKLLCFG